MLRLTTLAMLALLPAAFIAAPASAQDDTVVMKDGSRKTGTIQEYDFRSLKLGIAGGRGSTSVRAEEIESVEWSGVPKDMKDAENLLASQNDEAAVEKFQAVLGNAKLRSVLRQEAAFSLALAQFRSGKTEEGVATLRSLLDEKSFPLSRHILAAHEHAVNGLNALRKSDEALGFVDAEIARLQKVSDTAAVVDRLKLLKCRTLIEKGEENRAQADCKALAASSSPIAAEAKVMLGRIALKAKNDAEAEKHFLEALQSPAITPFARAASWNGLGMILQQKGVTQKKAEPLKEALLAFLRAVVQFPPAAGESSEHYETGLFRAAQCFKGLAELDKPGDVQTQNFVRAVGLLRRLLREYPGSQQAAEAQQLLNAIQQK